MLTVTNHISVPAGKATRAPDEMDPGTVFECNGGLYVRLHGGALRLDTDGLPTILDYSDLDYLGHGVVRDIPITLTVGNPE